MKRTFVEIRKNGGTVVASAIVIFSMLILSCSRADTSDYSVMKGIFRQSVMETGELQALNAYSMFLPRIN